MKIDELTAGIELGRPHQNAAVRWALERLIAAGQDGVILADEVGSGKTYEALAILALLWQYYSRTRHPMKRVLILCKPALLRKWHEELASSPNSEKHGILSYLQENHWQSFRDNFLNNFRLVNSLDRARRMRAGKDGKRFAGRREANKLQVHPGLYLVNQNLLYESKRCDPTLKLIYKTDWDLVIVDEAHHYGKGNKCDRIFATQDRGSGRNATPDYGAQDTLQFKHILLLTATPFELSPKEMLNLFRIIKANKQDICRLETLLENYDKELGELYNLRALSPANEQRKATVERLREMRLGMGRKEGLEIIMRRYLVRNQKDALPRGALPGTTAPIERAGREYSLVNRVDERWSTVPFDKFDDLKALIANQPLIPFKGPDILFYLELRELLSRVGRSRKGDDQARGTFIAMDLQQGLSSYPQLLARADKGKPKRLLESQEALYLRTLIKEWHEGHPRRLHPKVQTLLEIVSNVISSEIERVEKDPGTWFAKIVIFNKLVAGTAPQLREELTGRLELLVLELLDRTAINNGFQSGVRLRERARQIAKDEISRAKDEFTKRCRERNEKPVLEQDLWKKAGFKSGTATHPVARFAPRLIQRATQPLVLYDWLRECRTQGKNANDDELHTFIKRQIIDDTVQKLDEIVDKYLDSTPDPHEVEERSIEGVREKGIYDLALLREKVSSPDIVARYDGDVYQERESNRMNFNGRWNPLVLVVSRVGEEGIDLQRQARYVFHYDLEWNPAKMEQREGRVDREGYGFAGEPIDIRFLLLKGTYEERIFQTVMQRDQWFQILMGQRRKELGRVPAHEKQDDVEWSGSDKMHVLEDEAAAIDSRLTREEKETVMLDLRPSFQGETLS